MTAIGKDRNPWDWRECACRGRLRCDDLRPVDLQPDNLPIRWAEVVDVDQRVVIGWDVTPDTRDPDIATGEIPMLHDAGYWLRRYAAALADPCTHFN